MKTVYIIVALDDTNEPIIASESRDIAEKELFDYMGYGIDESVSYLGFKRYVYSEHEDSYIGRYTFYCDAQYNIDKENDCFELYLIDLL